MIGFSRLTAKKPFRRKYTICEGCHPTGRIIVEVESDDIFRFVKAVSNNQSSVSAQVEIRQIDNGHSQLFVFPPGLTEVQIPITTTDRIVRNTMKRTFWDGVEVRVLIPAP